MSSHVRHSARSATTGSTDVARRTGMGLDPEPMKAYARSGYAEKIVAERVGGQAAGWGA